ncbi:MAG TPA: hypothetical protein VMG59_02150 [Phycisphaerae bacterium]|nr:hypothetical protein [Phycisphaerae bacterium]
MAQHGFGCHPDKPAFIIDNRILREVEISLIRVHYRRRRADETYEQWRQRMLDETSLFIEWGLKHPGSIPRIPTHLTGFGEFSGQVKKWFWEFVLTTDFGPSGW